MGTRNIIVIGASAGGFEALKKLVAGLPKDLQSSLFIVWHMSPDIRGIVFPKGKGSRRAGATCQASRNATRTIEQR